MVSCIMPPSKNAYSESNEASPLHPWENNSDQVKAFFNHYVWSNVHQLLISIQDFKLIKDEQASDNYMQPFDAWQSQHVCNIIAFLIPTKKSHTQKPMLSIPHSTKLLRVLSCSTLPPAAT